jgi:hypothetical protein
MIWQEILRILTGSLFYPRLWLTCVPTQVFAESYESILTVFLANCQVTTITFSDEARSPQLSIC